MHDCRLREPQPMRSRRGRLPLPAVIPLAVAAFLIGRAPAQASLYDDLGGKPGVTAIADGTIDRALQDDRIKATFEDVNIPRLKRFLFDQFCELTGGPCKYRGQTMKQAHRGLHLRDSDFNALAEDMELAMEAQGIPYTTQSRFLARLAPMNREIVAH